MKLMFASDIHGSRSACEAMLNAYKAEGAERLILLGDLLYHGPRNNLPDEYDPKVFNCTPVKTISMFSFSYKNKDLAKLSFFPSDK